jgi:predicted glutamine amidotransferase
MCGILGLFGNDSNVFTNAKRGFINDGLYIGALRGQDSTGAALLWKEKGKAPLIYKRALTAADYIQTSAWANMLRQLGDSYGIMGHNRSMTRGAIEDDNAHPFQFGDITLVHNGTINNAEFLLPIEKRLKWADCKVDSAHAAHAIANGDADELLSKMTGGFSLVWWDAKDGTLHFARNDQRPMWWAVAQDKKTLYYASEKSFLYTLCARLDIKILDDLYKYTAPNIHYILTDHNDVTKVEKRPFLLPSHNTAKVVGAQGGNKGKGKWKAPTSGTPATTVVGGNASGPFVPSHRCQLEELSAGIVHAITTTSTKSEDRVKKILALCEKHDVAYRKTIIVEPKGWKAYKDETKMGFMTCKHPNLNIYIQVFGITFGKYSEEILKERRIPVEIFNYREAYNEDGMTPVFVADVNWVLLNKMKDSRGRDEEFDNGTKTDWIPVGPPGKARIVSPLKFNSMVADGCASCSKGLLPKDAPDLVWVADDRNEEVPLCAVCGNNPVIVQEWNLAAIINNGGSNSERKH